MRIKALFSLERWGKELRSPRYTPAKKLLKFINLLRSFRFQEFKGDRPLMVWDARANSITFDIVFVMLQVYIEEIYKKEELLDVVIYIPRNYKLRSFKKNESCDFVSDNELYFRIENIILPIVRAFSFCEKVLLVRDEQTLINMTRESKYTIPRFYHPRHYYPQIEDYVRLFKFLKSNREIELPNISFDKGGVSSLRPTMPSGRYATFTLRDYGWAPERNSTKMDVDAFLELTTSLNISPVIVPDDLNKLCQYCLPKEILIASFARKKIEERWLIYRGSEFNILPNSGPAALSLLTNGTRTIIYNYGVNSIDANLQYLRSELGLQHGDQPFRKFMGYIIWKQHHPNITAKTLSGALDIIDGWADV
jgi:hypothetical protein